MNLDLELKIHPEMCRPISYWSGWFLEELRHFKFEQIQTVLYKHFELRYVLLKKVRVLKMWIWQPSNVAPFRNMQTINSTCISVHGHLGYDIHGSSCYRVAVGEYPSTLLEVWKSSISFSSLSCSNMDLLNWNLVDQYILRRSS